MLDKYENLGNNQEKQQEFLKKLRKYGPFYENKEIVKELKKLGRIGRELYLEGDDITEGNDKILSQESVSQ